MKLTYGDFAKYIGFKHIKFLKLDRTTSSFVEIELTDEVDFVDYVCAVYYEIEKVPNLMCLQYNSKTQRSKLFRVVGRMKEDNSILKTMHAKNYDFKTWLEANGYMDSDSCEV